MVKAIWASRRYESGGGRGEEGVGRLVGVVGVGWLGGGGREGVCWFGWVGLVEWGLGLVFWCWGGLGVGVCWGLFVLGG